MNAAGISVEPNRAVVCPARILIVEDERIVAMSLRQQLVALGYTVVGEVCSGVDAIRKADELRPDLVLMDIRLEGDIDGVEAASAVRDRFQIPVVYLTAYSNKDILDRAKVTQPFGYILKPFEDRELHVIIETALYKNRAEQKLSESERRYRATVNSVGDGIIAVDSKGCVTLLNPVAERMTGWKQIEAAGQPLHEVLPIASDTSPFAGSANVMSPRNVIPGPRTGCLVTRDGRKLYVEERAFPIATENQSESEGFVLAVRDITDQRQLEAAIQQAQKLESLGLLAGGIAHDFNNLLTPILGYADLLKSAFDAESTSVAMAEAIETAARAAAQLTRQMLAYAGKGQFVIKPLNMSQVVREMAALLSASLSKKAEVQYKLQHDLPVIEADLAQLRQVIMNLLTNASESLGENPGRIVVSTSVVKASGNDLVSRFVPETPHVGEYVVLKVADSGSGIPEDILAHIFDPFFSTKFTGRGLGLAAVLGIVRGHRGTLKVHSTPGQGSEFEVFFPKLSQAADAAPSDAAPSDAVPDAGSRGTVLVAEDEAAVRTLIERTLSMAGVQTTFARDGREAVEIFQQQQSQIGCVLLDLTMPHLSGTEVLAAIRTMAPEIPVIVTSGYSPEDLAGQFAGHQLAGIVQKPFRRGELVELIQKAMNPSRDR